MSSLLVSDVLLSSVSPYAVLSFLFQSSVQLSAFKPYFSWSLFARVTISRFSSFAIWSPL